MRDDATQAARASAVIDALTAEEQWFFSLVTVVEVHWVLRRAYQLDTARCAALLEGLLDARELVVASSEVVRAALEAAGSGVDFADAVIAELGRGAGCLHTVTFDRRAARSGQMRLLT